MLPKLHCHSSRDVGCCWSLVAAAVGREERSAEEGPVSAVHCGGRQTVRARAPPSSCSVTATLRGAVMSPHSAVLYAQETRWVAVTGVVTGACLQRGLSVCSSLHRFICVTVEVHLYSSVCLPEAPRTAQRDRDVQEKVTRRQPWSGTAPLLCPACATSKVAPHRDETEAALPSPCSHHMMPTQAPNDRYNEQKPQTRRARRSVPFYHPRTGRTSVPQPSS